MVERHRIEAGCTNDTIKEEYLFKQLTGCGRQRLVTADRIVPSIIRYERRGISRSYACSKIVGQGCDRNHVAQRRRELNPEISLGMMLWGRWSS